MRSMGAAFSGVLSGTLIFGAQAGDLVPPGSPDSTPGPDPRVVINQENTPGDDAAHFIITAPGSYRLPGNFKASQLSTRNGIVIEASDVTIDLGGFTLDGFNIPFSLAGLLSNDTLTGILASGSVQNIVIRNGGVRDWGLRGIDLSDCNVSVVEDVVAVNNSQIGIWTGDRGAVRDCTARGNSGTGIRCEQESLVTRCISSDNGQTGIRVINGSLMESCTASRNTGTGFSANGASVVNCVASLNEGNGFTVTGATVTGCTSDGSRGDGILAQGYSTILNNTVSSSGLTSGDGAGIHVIPALGGNRIEGNTVSGGDRGIEVAGGGNVIVGNVSRSNGTPFVIAAGNAVGPVITAANPIASTNPWANFSM